MVHSAKPASPQPQAPLLTAAVKSTVERGITLTVDDQFEMPDFPHTRLPRRLLTSTNYDRADKG